MTFKIKKYQKKELMLLKVPFDDNMNFDEARELIEKESKKRDDNRKKEAKNKAKNSVEDCSWKSVVGLISKHNGKLCVIENLYDNYGTIISSFEDIKDFSEGDIVSCDVGNPAQYRKVAKNLKKIGRLFKFL